MYKILKNIIEMDDYSVQKLSKSQSEPFQWNTVEGTEINVNDCIGGKGKIEVKGNTYQENRILPEGYTQVDYIESHGKEYIDTGVNADSNLRTVLDMAYTEPKAANQNVGAINMDKGQVRYHIVPQFESFRIYIQNSSFINTISLDTNRHLYDIDVPNHIIKVDKNNYSLNTTSFNVELNFWLFGRNSDSTIYKSKNKLYKCRMYVSGVLVRDFIPCYRNSDNEVGLYDLVNGVFYTNQGTGAFTYGSVVTVPNTDFEIPIKVVTGNNVIKNVGKNYNLNLGTIELCKIDNYQDTIFKNVVGDENYNAELDDGAWYKKKVIDKKFLDGEMYFANSGVTNVFYTPVITNYSRINNKPFCDNFKGFNNVDTASSVTIINSVGFNNAYNYNRLYISFNGTIDELKDFLNEKMPTLYYANDNPTYEKITDPTLISQLEALRKAKWFKGVNHWWTETDNLEPNLKGTYRQAINE